MEVGKVIMKKVEKLIQETLNILACVDSTTNTIISTKNAQKMSHGMFHVSYVPCHLLPVTSH